MTIDRNSIPNRDARLDRLFDEHDGSHKNHCDLCLLMSLVVHFAAEAVLARHDFEKPDAASEPAA